MAYRGLGFWDRYIGFRDKVLEGDTRSLDSSSNKLLT